MRYLAARNPRESRPITLVSMREDTDCLTCVTAMLLGITYEEVERAFGGNIDPTRESGSEENRLYRAFRVLLERHRFGIIETEEFPPITEGRRYWLGVQIREPGNALSDIMSHSIVLNEFGRVFDPNPQYGEFNSLSNWKAAVPHPHQVLFATEVFEYTL
jgi:hypothetical protein